MWRVLTSLPVEGIGLLVAALMQWTGMDQASRRLPKAGSVPARQQNPLYFSAPRKRRKIINMKCTSFALLWRSLCRNLSICRLNREGARPAQAANQQPEFDCVLLGSCTSAGRAHCMQYQGLQSSHPLGKPSPEPVAKNHEERSVQNLSVLRRLERGYL